jgi:putative redox protein
MATVKEKTIVTQRVHGNCPTHSRTEIATRDVTTIVDEPKERDGTNMGPAQRKLWSAH